MTVRHALSAILALTMVTAVACDDDDDDNGGPPVVENFEADLTGAAERPDPVVTTATGTATFTLTTSGGTTTVDYSVTVSDLSGPVTAAHIHGPAGVDDAADPIQTLNVSGTGTSGVVVSGSFQATATLLQHLRAGNTYINLHTADNPAGEIRGQITEN